jgi:cytochrome c peroxidase
LSAANPRASSVTLRVPVHPPPLSKKIHMNPKPFRRDIDTASRWTFAIVALLATNGCDSSAEPAGAQPTADTRAGLSGEQLFSTPFPGAANERTCATCHVPEDDFTLKPDHVARLLQTNPDDPLFSAIDADDPTAEPLTFEHLKKGLVRVWLTLPDNVDLIDEAGNVASPPNRKLFVWRGVPSIVDVAITAPFQLDGRVATLEEQAQGAITGHSEGLPAPSSELERLAAFELGVFSSDRARRVSEHLAAGGDAEEARNVEDELFLTPTEERGRVVYDAVCAGCHGGANTATIVDRKLHDLAFPALGPDGNVIYQVPATDPPTPLLAAQPGNEFVNIGSILENFLVQLGATEHESFTKDLSFPSYRYRFYTDASRSEVAADLPPALPPGDPFAPASDTDGNPVTGPNFFPQAYSTDPGRAMITGSPYDFEALDSTSLRGIAKTAPYFHNNGAATLEDVVALYSDHLFSRFPSLTQAGDKEHDDDGDIGPEEALTAEQKSDLVAFLKRL